MVELVAAVLPMSPLEAMEAFWVEVVADMETEDSLVVEAPAA